MRYVIVMVFLLAGVAAAQQWQVELVDTSCRPRDVFVKRDSARTYVAYVTGVATIRIATKDTIWHYETLDTSVVHASFHFALGPAGRMAVSGVDSSYRPVVVEKSDSVWSRIWEHESLDVFPPAMAVYGADSVPAVVYGSVSQYSPAAYVIVETWLDSVWQVDTAVRFEPQTQDVELTLYDADGSREAGPCFLFKYGQGLPKFGQSPWDIGVYKGYRSGAGWSLNVLGGGMDVVVYGYDIVAGGPDTASAAVYSGGYTMFDHDTVCGGITDAAVQVDSAGRDQIAFVTSDSVLRFAYKDTCWHYREVPGVTTARCCDLALDDSGQPLIAFEDASGRLWLAHGIDMFGVSESPRPRAPGRRLEPTVVRGVLFLPEASSRKPQAANLLDIGGRKVMELHAGANDVSRLAPGVYFVREAQAQSQAVRKVVIQR